MMTISKRRRIFYLLISVFLVLGTLVVLYVNGWRLDLATLKIEKVGGIFIRSFPQDAKIELDGKAIENKSGFFAAGTLINNLFPKSYKLRLVRDDYQDWEENVSVAPSFVTEESLAVLVPKKSDSVATGSIKNFWIVGDKTIVQDYEDNLSVGKKKISRGGILSWTKDGTSALVKRSGSNSYSLVYPEKNSVSNVNNLLSSGGLSVDATSITLDPQDGNRLIVSEAKKISTFDVKKMELAEIYKSKSKNEIVGRITASDFLISWTKFNLGSNTSSIVVFDKFLQKVLYESSDLPGKNLDIAWAGNKKFAVLQDNGELYLYDASENDLKRIAFGIRSFEITGDSSRLAALGNNALEIFSTENNQGYHRFNLPEVQSVASVKWYQDNDHLFVFYGDRVSFLDLNDASLSNLIVVVRNYKRAMYNREHNQFYILKDGDVERFDFPR